MSVYPPSKKKDTIPSRPKKDVVLALAEISLEEDEQIKIKVRFCSNSDTKFRGRSAVIADSTMVLHSGLPSIMQADIELLSEYFKSISQHLVVEHNTVTGVNVLGFSG